MKDRISLRLADEKINSPSTSTNAHPAAPVAALELHADVVGVMLLPLPFMLCSPGS